MTNIQKAGLLSVGTIFFWALLNVSLRYFVIEYDCQPIAIACSNSLFCAVALLLIGSKKVNPLTIIRNPNTWMLGLSQICKNVCLIYAFVYISSTEANLLTNIEIVISVLLTWIVLHRRPNFIDFWAMSFILFGCFIIIANLPINIMFIAVFWIFCGSVFTSVRAILVELHPQNRQQMSITERCATTGWIMFAGSVAFCLFFMLISLYMQTLGAERIAASVFFSHLPAFSEFFYLPTLIGGAVTGIVFYAISMYFYFYAISLSTNEYFMMFRSFQAVCTYLVEFTFAAFTALPLNRLSLSDWIAATAIILSSVSMIMMRSERGRDLLMMLEKKPTLNKAD